MATKTDAKAVHGGTLVVVRRKWNDWQKGAVYLRNLWDVHWDETSGGVRARAPRLFIHGYMSCDMLVSGEVAHSCTHGPGPHLIKVCVLQKDNSKDVMDRLLKIIAAEEEIRNFEGDRAPLHRAVRTLYLDAA